MNFIHQMVQESSPTLKSLTRLAARNGARFLEIGSYVGESTSIFCEELKKFKDTKITCVDLWGKNNFGVDNTFEVFIENMTELGNMHMIEMVRMDSREAHKNFPDRHYDLVYIDGDHFYAGAKSDIINYKTKSKKVYCGHDCEMRYEELPSYLFDNMESECESFKYGEKYPQCPYDCVHNGVIKAVHEVLPKYYVKNRVWYVFLRRLRFKHVQGR